MCSRELERELIKQARRRLHSKIDKGEFNGDTLDNILLVILNVQRGVEECQMNPMVQMGEVFRKHPKLVIPALISAWVITGASALVVILGFLETIGLSVYLQP